MFLTSYPVEDLALRPSFVDASRATLAELAPRLAAEGLGDLTVVVGYLDRLPSEDRLGRPAGSPQNAAAVLHGGAVVARYAKHHLPNYGVFDEARYFVSGEDPCVVRVGGVDIALAICEDLWQEGGPVAQTRAAAAGLLLVINGSPYEVNKDDVRLELCRLRAAQAGCTLAYVNLVGAQDELVFDGDSLVVGVDGTVLERAAQFVEELLVVDLALPLADPARTPTAVVSAEPVPHYDPRPGRVVERLTDDAEVYAAITVALRDYTREERLPVGHSRTVRGHRLGAGRGHRLRRAGRGQRLRRQPAERLLLPALTRRRRRPRPPHRLPLPHRRDRADGRRPTSRSSA